MISSEVTLLPTSSIIVSWEDRYSGGDLNLEHITSLAADIAKRDLIHTILVEQGTNKLIAGGHRLRAFLLNAETGVPDKNPLYEDWTKIPARFAFDIKEGEAAHIELVENIQHRVLPWDVRADIIARIHQTEAFSHESWDASRTAELLGCSHSEVIRSLRVSSRFGSTVLSTDLRECPTLNAAFNIVMRAEDREKSTQLESLLGKGKAVLSLKKEETSHEEEEEEGEAQEGAQEAPSKGVKTPPPILLEDFSIFLQNYQGPRFNLLHCDPPYGINLSSQNGQNTRKDWAAYSDTPDDYFSFLQTLALFARKHMTPSAHIMLWLSPTFLRTTLLFLDEHFPEWTVQEFPMIWHFSDNAGLCPDPQRYGRRNYEIALLLTRGDRKIVQSVSLSFSFPKKGKDRIHQSEKPFEMVRHFLSMFVDEHTVFLDPTTGSGRPLQAAHSLGASSVLGLERDPTIHSLACSAWENYLLKEEEKEELE